jgi:phospholipase/carboxylesterase
VPAPLVLMLHGAGGNAQGGLRPLQDLADEAGLILLAVESRQRSWDLIIGRFGPDVAFVDRALTSVFERYAVDPAHLAVEGFSDGASYALSLGIANGDLFTHVLAFSPGFVAAEQAGGQPRMFVSHGTYDEVLPIDRCSRRIVPLMQRGGYDVRYREFEGGHTVPPEIAREALGWLAGG